MGGRNRGREITSDRERVGGRGARAHTHTQRRTDVEGEIRGCR